FAEDELAAKRGGNGVASHVVFGWTQAPGYDNNFRARQTIPNRAGKTNTVVANDQFANDFDAQVVKLLREEQRVGIDALWRQQLRADGYDFGVWHGERYGIGRPAMPASTR